MVSTFLTLNTCMPRSGCFTVQTPTPSPPLRAGPQAARRILED